MLHVFWHDAYARIGRHCHIPALLSAVQAAAVENIGMNNFLHGGLHSSHYTGVMRCHEASTVSKAVLGSRPGLDSKALCSPQREG